MTVRSWAWTECYDGIDIPRGAYIATKPVATYAPPAALEAETQSYALRQPAGSLRGLLSTSVQGGGRRWSRPQHGVW